MSSEALCNGKTKNLPSLEVVKTVPKVSMYSPCTNWLLHFHYARHDFDYCKTLIEQQLRDYVYLEYVYFIKGLIEREEGNFSDALRDLQKALDVNPNNLEIYKEIGKTLYGMGRHKQALSVLHRAEDMANRPDHEIFYFIGDLLYRNALQNNTGLDEVKDYFQKSITYGKKLESFQKLAEIYKREKDYAKAIEILENSLHIAPENTQILTEVGILYLKLNETQRAFDKLLEVANVNERCPRGLFAFGAILQSRGDIDGSLIKYQRISPEKTSSSELWNNIGLCFFKKSKLIVAMACFKKSVWLSPLDYNCLYNLSLVFITAQQYASAFHSLAAAINLSDSAECYMLLGICLRKLEDYENAYISFERAASFADAVSNPLIYLNFALFCYETGRNEKATINLRNFSSVSQDMALPTEYKFAATKLKALLHVADAADSSRSTEDNDGLLIPEGDEPSVNEN